MLITLKENEMTTLMQKFGVVIDLPEVALVTNNAPIVSRYDEEACYSIGCPKWIGCPKV